MTVDDRTYTLTRPFMVIARAEPDRDGGHLPAAKAQRDHFTARIPWVTRAPSQEQAMLEIQCRIAALDSLEPVAPAGTSGSSSPPCGRCTSPSRKQYVIRLVAATLPLPSCAGRLAPGHAPPAARWPNPRRPDGRDFVIPDDMQALASHRLFPAEAERWSLAHHRSGHYAIVGHLPLPQLR